ncbi:F-box protein CPR1-like [Cornus florida]|uniref:F-box protein CPR1-like n=1 Tax=Cornus florida TaxID=4283 RepID=UPI00289831B5|nr:F-box protein CPR1-like [Cornus florida]
MDFEDLNNSIVNLHLPQIPSWSDLVMVLGSCNGLLLCRFTRLYLFNPTTRQCKRLPPSGFCLGNFGIFGIGYDSSNDDYLAVKGHCSYSKSTKTTVYRVKLYSRRTNSWERTLEFPYTGRFLQVKGEFVNGSLHWLRLPLGHGSKLFMITSFDLKKKKFGEMPVPDCDCGDTDQTPMISVSVLNGFLCVCHYTFQQLELEHMDDERVWREGVLDQVNNHSVFFNNYAFVHHKEWGTYHACVESKDCQVQF